MCRTFMNTEDEDPIMQQCISLGNADFDFLQIIWNSRKEKAKHEIETGKREPTIAELEIMCAEALAARQDYDAMDTIPADYSRQRSTTLETMLNSFVEQEH